MSEPIVCAKNNNDLAGTPSPLVDRSRVLTMRTVSVGLKTVSALLFDEVRRALPANDCHVDAGVFDLAAAVNLVTTIFPDPLVNPGTEIRMFDREHRNSAGRLIRVVDSCDGIDSANGDRFVVSHTEVCDIVLECIADAKASTGPGCVSARNFREKLLLHITETAKAPGGERLLNFVHGELAQWHRKKVHALIVRSLIEDYNGACQDVFERYIDAAHQSDRSGVRVLRSQFMEEVERASNRGPMGERQSQFRTSVLRSLAEFVMANPGKPVPYNFQEDLDACIAAFVERSILCLAQATPAPQRFNDMKRRMIARYGFCSLCVEHALDESLEHRTLS